jgi:hypothetical protein
MKIKTLFIFLLVGMNINAQTSNEDVNQFIKLFKSQISKFEIGKIEEHFEDGYFKVLKESEYFDKDVEVGITSIYQQCIGKDNKYKIQQINSFFEQNKKLKSEKVVFFKKMDDYNFAKPFLRIRIFSDALKSNYENIAIIRENYKGLISVVVVDLPSGIGSLDISYLRIWNKSEEDIYNIAKNNTLSKLSQKFEKEQVSKEGEEYYLLANDINLYITSSILDLKKANIPLGKYGTLISIPNNTVILALPLNDKINIDKFSLNFMGLTNYMFNSQETKPISDNLNWYDGKEIYLIEKDIKNKKLIYPDDLKKNIEK